MKHKLILLDHHCFFEVSGEDAASFLQGLITQDIDKVTKASPQYSCFLTPQGKFLYDFFIHSLAPNHYLIEIHDSFIDAFLKKLSFYKLRATVTLNRTSAYHSHWSEAPHADALICYQDPRHAKLGYRFLSTQAEAPAHETYYREIMLELGIPYGAYDLIQEKTFLLEAHLDRLHAIDFDKGCYVGQELTARMHHTTTLKKQLLPLICNAPITAEPRTPIHNQSGIKIGELYSSLAHRGFGMIRTEHLDETTHIAIESNDGKIWHPDYMQSLS